MLNSTSISKNTIRTPSFIFLLKKYELQKLGSDLNFPDPYTVCTALSATLVNCILNLQSINQSIDRSINSLPLSGDWNPVGDPGAATSRGPPAMSPTRPGAADTRTGGTGAAPRGPPRPTDRSQNSAEPRSLWNGYEKSTINHIWLYTCMDKKLLQANLMNCSFVLAPFLVISRLFFYNK